jgi:cytochrome c-type biogenesis protein CcmH
MKNFILISLLFAFSAVAIDIHTFETEEQRSTYKKLTEELRCLVCQNQNIADSDAELAQDLRREVAEMVQAGQTEVQISDFMVERYGDFVQYTPPLRMDTIMLWVLPVIVFFIAAFVMIRSIKRTGEDQDQ